MVHRGHRWDNMGGDGKSKTLAALLKDSTETFQASSDTYRPPPESPQAHSVKDCYSCFVLVNNLWAYFRAPLDIKCNRMPAWQQQPVRVGENCQTACKPGSVRPLRDGTTIPLGRVLQRASRDQPERRDRNVPAIITIS